MGKDVKIIIIDDGSFPKLIPNWEINMQIIFGRENAEELRKKYIKEPIYLDNKLPKYMDFDYTLESARHKSGNKNSEVFAARQPRKRISGKTI